MNDIEEIAQHCEKWIKEYWKKEVKYLAIDPGLKYIELRTLILKKGYRRIRVGSYILGYLKRRCDEFQITLLVPMGVSKQPNKLRNFYEQNGLTQTFIDDFEYWVYQYNY